MTQAENPTLEQRKADLVAEAEAALDAEDIDRFDLIELQIINLNTLINYTRPDAVWKAIEASSRR